MPTCFPDVFLRESGDSPIVTGTVYPDHAMDLLSPCHRASFGPHATGIKAKWMINSRTDHVVDMRGRGYKAMSGNCCRHLRSDLT